MFDTDIKIHVSGPEKDRVSQEIVKFFKSKFKCKPNIYKSDIYKNNLIQEKKGKKDFIGAGALIIGLTSLIISIPGNVFNSLSLLDRMDKKKKSDDFIKTAKKLAKEFPDTNITIKTDSKIIKLHLAKSSDLFDEFDK